MSTDLAAAIWIGVGAYLGVGALTAAAVLIFGLRRIDPLAAEASLAVKLIWSPGIAALWPVMLAKWMIALRTPQA